MHGNLTDYGELSIRIAPLYKCCDFVGRFKHQGETAHALGTIYR